MKTEIIDITPEFAAVLLGMNKHNRPKSLARVEHLANIMKKGEWVFNGDTIRLSKSGRLLDGQHRLSAIAKSGVTQKCIVVSDLDDDTFSTIDVGKTRTGGDMLAIDGVYDYNVVSSAAYMVIQHINTGNPYHGNPKTKPTKTNIVDFVRANPRIQDSAKATSSKRLKKILTPSILCFCHYVFNGIDEDRCESFFNDLASGVSYEESPIIPLRDRLMLSKVSNSSKLTKPATVALIFRAFKSYVKGEKLTRVVIPKDPADWFKI